MFYRFVRLLLTPIFRLLFLIRIEGKENIPKDGPYIACANHMSAIDPILIGVVYPHRIYCMAKVELFKNKLVAWALRSLGAFPVKRGEPDMKSIKTALKILNEGKILGLFPEGTRNNSDELRAEPGLALLAIRSKAPVLPISIICNYKIFNKTRIIVNKPILLEQYFDRKLQTEDYQNISLEIMKGIKNIVKGEQNENNIRQ
ncbi:MAG: lysophospholipid acyltransferase family protein [Bacillota bacterium]